MKIFGAALYRRNERVVDLDDGGRTVPQVIWVEHGASPDPNAPDVLEAYQTDALGRVKRDPADGGLLTYTAKGRFKVVPLSGTAAPPKAPRRVAEGASRCARCPSVLTLPGSDLCAACNALDRNYRNKFTVPVVRPADLLSPRGCAHKNCNRPGAFGVSDEVEASPAVGTDQHGTLAYRLFGGRAGAKVLYERGATVGRSWYCPFHFKPPRLLDPKGEVVEVLDEAHGVRPQ